MANFDDGVAPKRIQRKRTKGWRMPPNTIYIGRGSKWGNPFVVGRTQIRIDVNGDWEHEGRLHKTSGTKEFFCVGTNEDGHPLGVWHQIEDASPEQCVTLYREYLAGSGQHLGWTRRPTPVEALHELRGKNLACWCPENQVCHGDVLLALANGVDS